jgi:hypothetical protein
MADGKNQGEGDYESARKYDAEQEAFAKSGKVEQAARKRRKRWTVRKARSWRRRAWRRATARRSRPTRDGRDVRLTTRTSRGASRAETQESAAR